MTTITASDIRDADQEPTPEDQYEADALEIDRAEATVAPDAVLRTDGGNAGDGEEYFPQLHVGDHVSDREDSDPTMVVVELPSESAAEYVYDHQGTKVADANPAYPADDDVILVVFPQRTDVDIEALAQYSYPRSRLRLEEPVHNRDESNGSGA